MCVDSRMARQQCGVSVESGVRERAEEVTSEKGFCQSLLLLPATWKSNARHFLEQRAADVAQGRKLVEIMGAMLGIVIGFWTVVYFQMGETRPFMVCGTCTVLIVASSTLGQSKVLAVFVICGSLILGLTSNSMTMGSCFTPLKVFIR